MGSNFFATVPPLRPTPPAAHPFILSIAIDKIFRAQGTIKKIKNGKHFVQKTFLGLKNQAKFTDHLYTYKCISLSITKIPFSRKTVKNRGLVAIQRQFNVVFMAKDVLTKNLAYPIVTADGVQFFISKWRIIS